jgi:hypothetical protein
MKPNQKQPMSVRKQLLLSALPLPSVLIHLIKEFAWTNVMVLAKQRKSRLTKGICTSTFTTIYAASGSHMFWIRGERYQFQSYFCKCGNYQSSRSFIILKCRCNCEFV